ncbi:MAG: diguanylate cyclase [Treponema sp.]|nr:diguanylate cyclase [Treponema sp.]
MMFSIKKKLVYLLVVCVFLTAVILGGIGLFKVTSVINQKSHSALTLVGSAEKQRLNVIISNLEQSVNYLEDITIGHITDVNALVQDEAYRNSITKELEYLAYSLVTNTNFAMSCYLRYNPELFSPTEGFFWLKSSSQSFMPESCTDISKYDADDIGHVGWYYIPVSRQTPTWIVPYYNENVGIYMVSYVVPVYVRNKLVCVVGMDVDFSYIVREIDEINPYKTGYAYMLDQKESVIYHRDYKFGSTVQTEEDSLEEMFILSNGWHLVTAVPKKEISTEKRQILPFMIIATLIVGFIFIVIAVYSVAHVINPLLELNGAIKEIAAGNMDINISCTSNDEIGMLAENFRKAIQKLPTYMYTDALTGIKKSSAYKRSVSDYESRIASRSMTEFAVLVFDVNNLKTTNDRYGHEAGNKLIVTASSFICHSFKSSPVFRIGGDEFVAVLQNSDYEHRNALIQAFDMAMFNEKIELPAVMLNLSIARGLAVYDASVDNTYADVFKRADDAMYENKNKMKGVLK